MTGLIEDLELKLMENGRYDEYTSILGSIQSLDPIRYISTLKCLLVTNEVLNQAKFGKFFVIGGYATLAHIVDVEGEKVIPAWRGSHDLDIVVDNKGLENYVKGAFSSFSSPRKHSHLPNKKVFELSEEGIEETCHIDYYYPEKPEGSLKIGHFTIDKGVWERAEVKHLFGIPIHVPSVYDLLKSKLLITTGDNLPREKDIDDILALLYVDEKKGGEPEKLYRSLNDFQRTQLVNIIQVKEHEDYAPKRKLQLSPSNKYLYDFKILYDNLK